MNAFLPRSLNIGAIGAALAWTTLTIGTVIAPAPAAAQTGAAYYTAELAQPADSRITVAGGVAWRCEGTTCKAKKGNSRPVRMCRELKRELGDVADFTTKGETLEAKLLERCNA
ncbi:CC_3452 family protein [Qipengyuania marisflavi]|uniref:Uncharacterized protein n=1 Tax=Qipengyuania marisflavi TaxID=2486356 RepID=A0A5S3P2N0_9SPHN|nr:hypothetical protein [Qipengyuania marisflavi]TMM47163.1 hypothetical protein FEV51_10285 [Qipengyuania marisflavi]